MTVEIPLNIIEFIEHPDLINDRTSSFAQKTVLKATYGLPLSLDELELYKQRTSREVYAACEQLEASILSGRRGGKTTKIAARIVIYEAFRDHGIPEGEQACVMLIAPALKQAQIAFRAIRRDILGSRVLSAQVVRSTKEQIELKNGITIECFACTYDHVRGHTIVAAVCDELAFWADEETAANPAEEVIGALLPGMATVRNSKLIKISTPYRKEGLLWREFQQRAELDFAVWQLSSAEMNPTFSPSILDRARRRGGEENFRREYLAEFTDTITGWVDSDALEACIVRGRREMPPVSNALYAAAVDPATRHDDFALAIVHREADGCIVLDRVAKWTGTKSAPLVTRVVLDEIKTILRQHGLNTVIGDQYLFDVLKMEFMECGVYYESRPFGLQTRAEIFGTLKHLLLQSRIRLVDDPDLLRQLRHLHEEKNPRGNVDVRPSGGMHDDLAVAVALAVTEIAKQPTGPSPFKFGEPTNVAGVRVGRNERGVQYNILPSMIPDTCPYQGICANFPRCSDLGYCQGLEE
jgi:hypothetical protein